MFYFFFKFVFMIGFYLLGLLGGIFVLLLFIGVGFGNLLYLFFGGILLLMLVVLVMVGYFVVVM